MCRGALGGGSQSSGYLFDKLRRSPEEVDK